MVRQYASPLRALEIFAPIQRTRTTSVTSFSSRGLNRRPIVVSRLSEPFGSRFGNSKSISSTSTAVPPHLTPKPPTKADPKIPQIHWSDNIPLSLPPSLLLPNHRTHPPWTLTCSPPSSSSSHPDSLTRTFTFRTFTAAFRFMTLVAEHCKKRKHHPTWTNTYNEVTVTWTTHEPQGLGPKDVEMAQFCDDVSRELGERGVDELSE
ncbi:transcriptional coactivator/pterin dehydratase [Delitschia confertaspora ATCC 74209]|uniref:4a-hydroxytetrahydrobiopterin dehydratase n=1 Tax=Delitschia confertaspora ATCC 74209 TaxID=1513339 RepID=A0A9P4MQD9_9PLEO|nr:transcriptional coactivator/pterin dehydratase [Delitschia confertaspora ATCC 74209]